MKVIGLTGQSGAGKGIVCELFASCGIPSVNADAVYRDLLVPPSACLEEIVRVFGGGVLLPNGTLDRKALGSIVFSDREALAKLNAVSHRYIMAEIRNRIARLRADGCPAVILDAPQLFEAKGESDCDTIVAVVAPEPVRLARIMRRDGITEAEARRRMQAQYPEAFFREHADYILENNGTPEALLPSLKAILRALEIPDSKDHH